MGRGKKQEFWHPKEFSKSASEGIWNGNITTTKENSLISQFSQFLFLTRNRQSSAEWAGSSLNWANTSQEKSLSALSPALIEKLTVSQLHQPAQLPACLCAPHMDKGRSQLVLPFPLQATYWHLCWFTDSKGSAGESHNSLQLPRIAELRRHWESTSHTSVRAASYKPVSMYVQKTERLSHFQRKRKKMAHEKSLNPSSSPSKIIPTKLAVLELGIQCTIKKIPQNKML